MQEFRRGSGQEIRYFGLGSPEKGAMPYLRAKAIEVLSGDVKHAIVPFAVFSPGSPDQEVPLFSIGAPVILRQKKGTLHHHDFGALKKERDNLNAIHRGAEANGFFVPIPRVLGQTPETADIPETLTISGIPGLQMLTVMESLLDPTGKSGRKVTPIIPLQLTPTERDIIVLFGARNALCAVNDINRAGFSTGSDLHFKNFILTPFDGTVSALDMQNAVPVNDVFSYDRIQAVQLWTREHMQQLLEVSSSDHLKSAFDLTRYDRYEFLHNMAILNGSLSELVGENNIYSANLQAYYASLFSVAYIKAKIAYELPDSPITMSQAALLHETIASWHR